MSGIKGLKAGFVEICCESAVEFLGEHFLSKNLRAEMPTVAAFIDQMRDAFGADFINETIRAGMQGQPVFHASENGHSVGTPLPYDARQAVSLADVSIGPWNRASAPQNATSKGKK